MAASTMSTSLLNTRTSVPTTRRFTSKPARAVRVFASSQEKRDVSRNEGPKDAVLKTFSALAAAQLAVLPFAGAALADIIPNKAERAEINERTSDLPTFGQVGDALKKNLGGGSDPKDIGRAIDRNTPDIDLTKNPKDIGKDIKRGIEKNTPNLPDLSEAPSPLDTAKEQKNQVIRQGSNAGQDLGKALPNIGNPLDAAKDLANKVQNVGGNAAQKAKNTVSDLSDLPNPFKGNSSPQGLANDAKNKAKSLGNEIGKNVPNAGDAKRAVDKNTPNLPNLGGGLPGSGSSKGIIPRNS